MSESVSASCTIKARKQKILPLIIHNSCGGHNKNYGFLVIISTVRCLYRHFSNGK
ncbi:Uncharacterised protein [Vibrio cholerae]|nr:Uncharacterised protein [Vibrio cholerae]